MRPRIRRSLRNGESYQCVCTYLQSLRKFLVVRGHRSVWRSTTMSPKLVTIKTDIVGRYRKPIAAQVIPRVHPAAAAASGLRSTRQNAGEHSRWAPRGDKAAPFLPLPDYKSQWRREAVGRVRLQP